MLRQANLLSFGHGALPTFDLARADYVISFGADFLGAWNSAVAQSIGYGEMRQGRPGRRAKFVQVESRMSQTGANCDEWIACRPGMEGALALGIAHVILSEKLAPQGSGSRAGSLIAGSARASALDRVSDAIGMVEHLQACLAAGAQLSLINGVLRIAFEFFRQAHLNQPLLTMTHDFCLALHNPHLQPAARGAKSAHAGLQGGNAGDQLFLGNETDELLVGPRLA